MGVLKKYVKVCSKPEGSIAQGYGTEVIEFCVDFIPDLAPIGVLESRHEGRLSGKGTLGKKTYIGMEDDYFNKAHYTVLQNSSLGVSTWKVLVVGCEKNVKAMTILMSNCICWLGSHRGISSRTKGMR